MDPDRSVYAGTAEARREETFTCATRSSVIRCDIVGIRIVATRPSLHSKPVQARAPAR